MELSWQVTTKTCSADHRRTAETLLRVASSMMQYEPGMPEIDLTYEQLLQARELHAAQEEWPEQEVGADVIAVTAAVVRESLLSLGVDDAADEAAELQSESRRAIALSLALLQAEPAEERRRRDEEAADFLCIARGRAVEQTQERASIS